MLESLLLAIAVAALLTAALSHWVSRRQGRAPAPVGVAAHDAQAGDSVEVLLQQPSRIPGVLVRLTTTQRPLPLGEYTGGAVVYEGPDFESLLPAYTLWHRDVTRALNDMGDEVAAIWPA